MRHTRLAATAAITAALLLTSPTYAHSNDPIGSIYAAAYIHGVQPGPMLRTARCESGFDAMAREQGGLGIGLFQLDSAPTGLLSHFYSVGYDDPFDAEQQADYYARVTKGEFLPTGKTPAALHPYGIVSTKRWSCNRGV